MIVILLNSLFEKHRLIVNTSQPTVSGYNSYQLRVQFFKNIIQQFWFIFFRVIDASLKDFKAFFRWLYVGK